MHKSSDGLEAAPGPGVENPAQMSKQVSYSTPPDPQAPLVLLCILQYKTNINVVALMFYSVLSSTSKDQSFPSNYLRGKILSERSRPDRGPDKPGSFSSARFN